MMDVTKCINGRQMDNDELCLAGWHPEWKCMHARTISDHPLLDFLKREGLTSGNHERITKGDHYE